MTFNTNTSNHIGLAIVCVLISFCNCSNSKKDVARKAPLSSCIQAYDSLSGRKIYTDVDVMPVFPGGVSGLSQFIAENYKKPNQTVIQGRIVLIFIVEKDGSLTHKAVEGILKPEITPMEKEGLRVLGLMPKWEPGRCNGKPVAVKMVLPVFI